VGVFSLCGKRLGVELDFIGSSVQNKVKICSSALEACRNAEAVVIATEWKEFREIEWEEVYTHMTKPAFVFDGRSIVDAAKLRQIGFKVTPFTFRVTLGR
jgi:UDPglucose 6-dehydrogenase